ncbi:MAG: hypothetical protein QNJ18_08610 [Xenococcaceae cyanobacterium MO_167.B52]|nr:hypothetical protein [Xenococcaceae cyanobacterium MO_167.B52]
MSSRVHGSSDKSNIHIPINTTLVSRKQTAQPVNTPELGNPKFLKEKERETEQKNSETTVQKFSPSSPEQPQEGDKNETQLQQQPELRTKSQLQQPKADILTKIKTLSSYGFDFNKIAISAPNRPPTTPPIQPRLKVNIPPRNRLQQRIDQRREETLKKKLETKVNPSFTTASDAPDNKNSGDNSNFAVQARTKLVTERNKNRRSLQKSPLKVSPLKPKVVNNHPTSTPWIERMTSFASRQAKPTDATTINTEEQKTLTAEKELQPLEAKKTNESNSTIGANKEKPTNSIKEKDAKPLAAKQVGNTPEVTSPQKEPKSAAIKNKDESEKTPEAPSSKDTSPAQPTTPNSPGEATDVGAGANGNPQENKTEPPKAVAINTGDPGQIIEQLKNTPPTQAATTYAQAQTASAQALEKQKQQVQATIPEIPAPTGLQGKQATESGQAAQKNASEAANVKGTSAGEMKGAISGQTASKYNTSVPEASPAPTPAATQLAGKEAPAEGEQDAALSRSAQNALNNVEINTSQISTSAGERPNVDLSGEANPTQIDTAQTQSGQEVGAAKMRAGQAIHQDFGENNIFPEPSNETLKANKELTALAPAGAKAGKSPAIPGEAAGGLNQSLSPFLKEKIGVEQDKYKTGKDKFDLDSVKAKTDANQEITNLNEEAKQKQLAEQNQAKSQVTQHKQEWKTELDSVEKDYQEKAGKATKEQRKKIGEEKAKGEKEAAQHLEEAEKKAEAEKQKADNEAAQKKKESEKESGGFWGWVKSKAKALIDGLKKAVNFIYDNLRKAVKFIFEAAKKLALAAIDLARQAIVGLIKAFGEILKGLVQVVFAAFPEIAKKINAKIDQAVNKAVQVVNAIADGLKKAVAAVLDFLANALDSLLKLIQDIYNGIFTVIGMIITGEFAELFKRIGNLIDAAKTAPSQFETAAYEELLGGNLDESLSPQELGQAQAAGINIPGQEGGSTAASVSESELPKPPWTEENVGVDAVENNMELSPELIAELMQQTNGNGEVMLGESNDSSRSMESIMSEVSGDKQEGGETEKQQHPDDGLTPRQRAEIKWELMKQSISKWWSDNWPLIIGGTTAALAVIAAALIGSGGSIAALIPPIMSVLAPLFAGITIATIGGHIRDYVAKAWEGNNNEAAGKSLAKGAAAGVIELISWLTFKAGSAAVKGAKAVAKGAKTVGKVGVKLAKGAARAVAKGAKYIIEKGKVLFKGIAGTGIGKQFKKLKDLGKGLLARMRFKAFRIRVANRWFKLEGLINPWVVIANGKVVEVEEGRSGAFRIADDEFATLKKGIPNDESLKQAVGSQRGFSSNTQALEELLKRTDIPQDRILRVRANLAAAIDSGKVSPQELQTFIDRLKTADSLDRFDQMLAEMHHPNRLVYSGAVAENSRIVTGAKKGGEYDLGTVKVKIDPVSEADALYFGKDSVVHLDEVKNTANALRQKLDGSPQQLERMKDWKNLDPDRRAVRVVVESEEGWTTLFGQKKGQKPAFQTLIDENVPLTIGDYELSVTKMQNLWEATLRKKTELGVPQKMSWKNFFEKMPTLKEAENFLGVSLK